MKRIIYTLLQNIILYLSFFLFLVLLYSKNAFLNYFYLFSGIFSEKQFYSLIRLFLLYENKHTFQEIQEKSVLNMINLNLNNI